LNPIGQSGKVLRRLAASKKHDLVEFDKKCLDNFQSGLLGKRSIFGITKKKMVEHLIEPPRRKRAAD